MVDAIPPIEPYSAAASSSAASTTSQRVPETNVGANDSAALDNAPEAPNPDDLEQVRRYVNWLKNQATQTLWAQRDPERAASYFNLYFSYANRYASQLPDLFANRNDMLSQYSVILDVQGDSQKIDALFGQEWQQISQRLSLPEQAGAPSIQTFSADEYTAENQQPQFLLPGNISIQRGYDLAQQQLQQNNPQAAQDIMQFLAAAQRVGLYRNQRVTAALARGITPDEFNPIPSLAEPASNPPRNLPSIYQIEHRLRQQSQMFYQRHGVPILPIYEVPTHHTLTEEGGIEPDMSLDEVHRVIPIRPTQEDPDQDDNRQRRREDEQQWYGQGQPLNGAYAQYDLIETPLEKSRGERRNILDAKI